MNKTFSLKENRDFRRMYHRGKSAATGHLVLYAAKNRLGYRRLGLTVSVKLGGAVQRNRVKRLLREAFRLHAQEFPESWDFVIVARTRAVKAKCQDIDRALIKAADELHLRQSAAKNGMKT